MMCISFFKTVIVLSHLLCIESISNFYFKTPPLGLSSHIGFQLNKEISLTVFFFLEISRFVRVPFYQLAI